MTQLALVTGASSGIGLELARCCARHGLDLILAADEPEIEDAAAEIRAMGREAKALQGDLSDPAAVDRLVGLAGTRPVDVLLANAGRGLGHAFVDQDWQQARHVIDTNIVGTLYLVQRIARDMIRRGSGRILLTGSIAGFMPGTFQAVYNASKAFIDSFAIALRHELQDSGVSVTLLMPGATEMRFFQRAGLLDTRIGQARKADAAEVAEAGFKAMMAGEEQIVTGWKNRMQVAAAHVTPAGMLAEQHRRMAEPNSGQESEEEG